MFSIWDVRNLCSSARRRPLPTCTPVLCDPFGPPTMARSSVIINLDAIVELSDVHANPLNHSESQSPEEEHEGEGRVNSAPLGSALVEPPGSPLTVNTLEWSLSKPWNIDKCLWQLRDQVLNQLPQPCSCLSFPRAVQPCRHSHVGTAGRQRWARSCGSSCCTV